MRLKFLLIFILIHLLLDKVVSQNTNFITYSLVEGLPQSNVYSICEDNYGYLWFGTRGGGLARFDGNKFEKFSTKNGLVDNYINKILLGKNLGIWIGSDRGLAYFDGKDFNTIISSNKNTKVLSLEKNDSNSIWIGTDHGLYQYFISEKLIKKYNHELLSRLDINNLSKIGANLWIGTNRGLWVLKDSLIEVSIGKDFKSKSILGIELDINNNLWILHNNGITVISPNSLEEIFHFSNKVINQPTSIIGDNEKIWVGTKNKGLFTFSLLDSVWTSVYGNSKMKNKYIRDIKIDSWKNVWIATSGGGVAKYVGSEFTHFDKSNGLPGNRIFDIIEDNNNEEMWLASSYNGIIKLSKSGDITSYKLDNNKNCKSLFLDKSKRLWIGTKNNGIIIKDSLGFNSITTDAGLPGNKISGITSTNNEDIWVAIRGKGISKISQQDSLNYSIKNIGFEQGLRDTEINCINTNKKEQIWFGTNSGKLGYIFNDRLIKVLNKYNGLPDVPIQSIEFDSLGNIWIGTAGMGIYCADYRDEDVFSKLKGVKPLTSDNITSIVFDANQNLWAGSENGIDRITIDINGNISELNHFGKENGFIGIENCQNASLIDREGNLWFGTMRGLTKYSLGKVKKQIFPPKIHFTDISLFYQSLKKTKYKSFVHQNNTLKDGLILNSKDNSLGFQFKGIGNSSNIIKYQWQLMGLEKEFSPLSSQKTVNYQNLDPGNYTFRVKACDEKNNCSDILASSFIIKKPIWQEWWFILSIIFFSIILIFTSYKRRILKIKKIEQEKRNQLEIKNQLLKLEQKALQLQMNPHFIFNALNSIQGLIATGDSNLARRELSSFAKLMRSIMQNSKKEKISLEQEILTLKRYLEIEKFCRENEFDFEIIQPENINAEEIELPPMLIQPYVENAVIHGINNLKEKGKIEIRFQAKNNILKCEIIDNGIGREKANLKRISGHQSLAMEVTKQRLENISKGKTYKSLEISDNNPDLKNVGTKIIIRLPLDISF